MWRPLAPIVLRGALMSGNCKTLEVAGHILLARAGDTALMGRRGNRKSVQ
jgi:hypothetical protein